MLFRVRAWIIEDFTTGNQRRGAQEACDGIGQRRFAAATFTREAKNFAPLQGEAYIGDGMYCAVGCQVIDIEMLHIQQSIGRNSCVSFRCHNATIFLALGTTAKVALTIHFHYATIFLTFATFMGRSGRRRGSAISSIPKLLRDRPAPSMAMQAPGGMNHHQRPLSAPACCAQ